MGDRRKPWLFALFSLYLFFSPGLGTARITRNEEDQETFSSSDVFSAQSDDVPVINPTTPGTANPSPTVNPMTPQAPDTTWQTPANPVTPTNPMATPTAPTTMTPTAPATKTPTAPTSTPPTSSSGQWCVASQTASDTALQVALDYACGYGGTDCSAIQPGASCYNPNTLRDHASYAFNDYYQKNPAPTSCAFGGIATLTSNDPSSGNCKYASAASPKAQSVPPPTTILSPPSPVTQTTPSMTYPGGGSTVYGSEPTGSPNSATSASYSLLLLFTTCGLWASFHVANCI